MTTFVHQSEIMEASNPWEDLPHELATEVLSRLPVKTLVRLKCVSKSWLSLISSPQFETNYLKISASRRRRFVFGSSTALHTFSHSPKFDEDPSVDSVPFNDISDDLTNMLQVVGSCNGLVCLVNREPGRTGSVILWNPATRKCRQLPAGIPDFWMCYGFGYDAATDDYKVVKSRHVFTSEMQIYSSRDDSWKALDWFQGVISGGAGVFLNGAIHWKVRHVDDHTKWDVVAQDLTTGNCRRIAFPRRLDHESPFRAAWLGVYSGERFCVCLDRYTCMDVWMMAEYSVAESWSRVVCFPFFFCAKDLKFRIEPVFVTEEGGLLLHVGSRLVSYRPFEYREIRWLSDVRNEVISYTESFVSPYPRKPCSGADMELKELKKLIVN